MAQVIINNEVIETEKIEESTTVYQLMEIILEDFATEEEVISNVHIDGTAHYLDSENEVFHTNLNKYDNINIEVTSSIDLAFEALDDCSGYIDTLLAKIGDLIEAYNSNDQKKANLHFSEVVEILDLYIQLMAKIYKTIRTKYPTVISDNKTIQNLEIHLLSVMKALLPAKEKNDVIMLCDLLEYELMDNLTQWKIQAIPELKKVRDN